MSVDPRDLYWRQGRKLGRTIYAQLAREPSDRDPLLGMMDTPELALEAVGAHNDRVLRDRKDLTGLQCLARR